MTNPTRGAMNCGMSGVRLNAGLMLDVQSGGVHRVVGPLHEVIGEHDGGGQVAGGVIEDDWVVVALRGPVGGVDERPWSPGMRRLVGLPDGVLRGGVWC